MWTVRIEIHLTPISIAWLSLFLFSRTQQLKFCDHSCIEFIPNLTKNVEKRVGGGGQTKAPIFTKLVTNTHGHCMEIFCTEFYANRTQRVESTEE